MIFSHSFWIKDGGKHKNREKLTQHWYHYRGLVMTLDPVANYIWEFLPTFQFRVLISNS